MSLLCEMGVRRIGGAQNVESTGEPSSPPGSVTNDNIITDPQPMEWGKKTAFPKCLEKNTPNLGLSYNISSTVVRGSITALTWSTKSKSDDSNGDRA